jgi:glutathione S-transferase
VSSYYYPYMSYHLSHERLIYPALGTASDEKVVAHALPRITIALDVMECELRTDTVYLLGDQLTLADFFVLPTLASSSMTPEGHEMLKTRPRITAWRARMEAQPAVTKVRAMVAPHIGKPVEHARKWVETHRPRY